MMTREMLIHLVAEILARLGYRVPLPQQLATSLENRLPLSRWVLPHAMKDFSLQNECNFLTSSSHSVRELLLLLLLLFVMMVVVVENTIQS